MEVPSALCDGLVDQRAVIVGDDVLGVDICLDFQVSAELLVLGLELPRVCVQDVRNHFAVLILVLRLCAYFGTISVRALLAQTTSLTRFLNRSHLDPSLRPRVKLCNDLTLINGGLLRLIRNTLVVKLKVLPSFLTTLRLLIYW